jgi:hypothetical protein
VVGEPGLADDLIRTQGPSGLPTTTIMPDSR